MANRSRLAAVGRRSDLNDPGQLDAGINAVAPSSDPSDPDDQPNTQVVSKPVDPTKAAASKLRLAKQLLKKGRKSSARRWLAKVVAKYPGSPQAVEAKQLLAAN